MNLGNWKWLLFFVLIAHLAKAQPTPVSITIKVDKDSVTIGDIVHITSILKYHSNHTPQGEGIAGLPPNEYLELQGTPTISKDESIDSTTHINWDIRKEEVDAMVFLDSGTITIQPIEYQLIKSDTTLIFRSDSARIFVKPIVTREEIPQGLRTIIKEPKKFSDYWAWIVGVAAFGLLAFLIYYLRKQKPQEVRPPKPSTPSIHPQEEAITALQTILNTKLWIDQPKSSQIQLSQILRRYLEREFNVPALEETTQQIEKQLRRLSPNQRAQLMRLLNDADLVKFAKLTMPSERQEESMLEAISWIKNNSKG